MKKMNHEQIRKMLGPLDISYADSYISDPCLIEIHYEENEDGCSHSKLWDTTNKTKGEIWQFINDKVLKGKILKFLTSIQTDNYGELQVFKRGDQLIAGWLYNPGFAEYFERDINAKIPLDEDLNSFLNEIETEDQKEL